MNADFDTEMKMYLAQAAATENSMPTLSDPQARSLFAHSVGPSSSPVAVGSQYNDYRGRGDDDDFTGGSNP